MSGAFSFVLGMLGLGVGGAVGLGQEMSQNKKIEELHRMTGADATGDRARMYERVRKERRSIHDACPNCLGKFQCEYPSGRYLHSQERNWFKAHLDAKGIPYDDIILDKVSGVTGDIIRNQMVHDAIVKAKRRSWF